MAAVKKVVKPDVQETEEVGTVVTDAETPKKEKKVKEEKGFTCASKRRVPVVRLLCEQKYTDAQIAEMAIKELAEAGISRTIPIRFVANNRRAINNGTRDEMIAALKFNVPKKPLEELVEYDGKIVPDSEVPEKVKKEKAAAKEKKSTAEKTEERLKSHGVELKEDIDVAELPIPKKRKRVKKS